MRSAAWLLRSGCVFATYRSGPLGAFSSGRLAAAADSDKQRKFSSRTPNLNASLAVTVIRSKVLLFFEVLYSQKIASFLFPGHPIYDANGAMDASRAPKESIMIRTDEIREGNGQIQLRLALLETAQLPPKSQVRAAVAPRPFPPYELNLSGSQLLIGCISALCAVGLLLWVFMKLWLFE